MENQITLEYYNAEKYENISNNNNNIFNEIIKNFTKSQHNKQYSNKKCPRCGSTKTNSKSGSCVCFICGDYF